MPTAENIGIRRQATLIKKAHQLSVLCDAEVGVIIFTSDGKLHEFSNTSMEHTLSRYKGKVEESRPVERRRREPAKPEEPKPCDSNILQELKAQHAALSLEKSRGMGKELDDMSREELRALEEQQLWALLSINNKKKELFVGMLQRSMLRDELQAAVPVQEEENLIRVFEGMNRERPYVVQDHSPDSMVSGVKSKADSLYSRPSEESDQHSDFLQLRL